MFGMGGGELVVLGLVALFVLGPERLPGAIRTVAAGTEPGEDLARRREGAAERARAPAAAGAPRGAAWAAVRAPRHGYPPYGPRPARPDDHQAGRRHGYPARARGRRRRLTGDLARVGVSREPRSPARAAARPSAPPRRAPRRSREVVDRLVDRARGRVADQREPQHAGAGGRGRRSSRAPWTSRPDRRRACAASGSRRASRNAARAVRRTHLRPGWGRSLAGVDAQPRVRRHRPGRRTAGPRPAVSGPVQIEVVADQDRLAHGVFAALSARGIGEDDGAGTGGARRPHRMHDMPPGRDLRRRGSVRRAPSTRCAPMGSKCTWPPCPAAVGGVNPGSSDRQGSSGCAQRRQGRRPA